MLPLEHSTTDVLSYLQKAAVLVQGNWVVKSDLIYPKDSTSSENGIPCDAICRARDYVVSIQFKSKASLCTMRLRLCKVDASRDLSVS